MSEVPHGQIQTDSVLLQGDSAITVYNRGYYGMPVHEGVRLTGFEALHLMEMGRITVGMQGRHLSERQVVEYFSSLLDEFMGRYLVYKDLRNRGYIANQGSGSSFFFRLYKRGDVPKKDSATYYVTPLREGTSVKLDDLDDLVSVARRSRKELVVGLVDASGDVSYLRINQLQPSSIAGSHGFMPVSSWDWKGAWGDYLSWDRS